MASLSVAIVNYLINVFSMFHGYILIYESNVLAIFILFILFIVGFFMGYNFSLNRSSSLYDTQESAAHHSLANTDSKSIATSSNSSVTNTNNDADTITNTVSSG